MKFPDPLKFRHCICSVTACCPCATPAHINPATNNEAAAFMAVFPPTAECDTRPQAAILRTYHSEAALPARHHAVSAPLGHVSRNIHAPTRVCIIVRTREPTMKTFNGMNLDAKKTRSRASASRHSLRAALCLMVLIATLPLAAQDQKDSNAQQSSSDNDSIGFNLGKNASAKDVGLPIYPGARRHKDDSNDSSGLNMGLWGGATGFKLFVLKMETTDAPEKVATFYRKALAKYGTVLDCSSASSVTSSTEGKSSKKLACEDEKPKPNEISLKAGTKEKQHAVGIEPNGTGATFHLVYIETKGSA